MMLILKSFIGGIILGLIFCGVNLPIPAPPTLGGVLGIVGVYIGYLIYNGLLK